MSFWNSGVQRLLDARGQRGSWMPSKIVSIRLAKFLTIFYYLVTYQNLSLFRISCQISRKFAPWMPPPVLHHVPVTKFFSSFLVIYLHFFYKSWPLGCPQSGCSGPSHRPHPPLHATVLKWKWNRTPVGHPIQFNS